MDYNNKAFGQHIPTPDAHLKLKKGSFLVADDRSRITVAGSMLSERKSFQTSNKSGLCRSISHALPARFLQRGCEASAVK